MGGAGAEDDEVGLVAATVVVADHRAGTGVEHRAGLGALVEGVATGRGHVGAQRGQRLARLDGGVGRAVQAREVLAAQGRVDRAHLVGVEQREPAGSAASPAAAASATASSAGVRTSVIEPAGRKPTPATRPPISSHSSRERSVSSSSFADRPDTQTRPKLRTVAPRASRLAFEVDDLVAAGCRRPGMCGAEDPSTDDDQSHGTDSGKWSRPIGVGRENGKLIFGIDQSG